jgi:hypothetical protein
VGDIRDEIKEVCACHVASERWDSIVYTARVPCQRTSLVADVW